MDFMGIGWSPPISVGDSIKHAGLFESSFCFVFCLVKTVRDGIEILWGRHYPAHPPRFASEIFRESDEPPRGMYPAN